MKSLKTIFGFVLVLLVGFGLVGSSPEPVRAQEVNLEVELAKFLAFSNLLEATFQIPPGTPMYRMEAENPATVMDSISKTFNFGIRTRVLFVSRDAEGAYWVAWRLLDGETKPLIGGYVWSRVSDLLVYINQFLSRFFDRATPTPPTGGDGHERGAEEEIRDLVKPFVAVEIPLEHAWVLLVPAGEGYARQARADWESLRQETQPTVPESFTWSGFETLLPLILLFATVLLFGRSLRRVAVC